MSNQTHSLEDVAKVYDTFFREHFKNHPEFSEIQNEYQSFKNELLKYASEMNENDFKQYTQRKKLLIKTKIQEMSVAQIPPTLAVSDPVRLAHQGKKNFFFDFLRGVAIDSIQVDSYLSSFRCHQARDLVKDGDIANYQEFSKVLESKINRGIQLATDPNLEKQFGPKIFAGIKGYLRVDDKKYIRVLDFSAYESSPLGLIFVTYFVAALEKNMTSRVQAISFLTDLYNVAHHLSLKTEHFMAFSNLSKYFQQLLIDLTTKRFESEVACQTFMSRMLLSTIHDSQVLRGLKLLCTSMLSLVLEMGDPVALTKVFDLPADESAREQRPALLDLLQGAVLRDRVSADNFAAYLPKIARLMNGLSFCLACPVQCYLLLNDGAAWRIQSAGGRPEEPIYLMVSPKDGRSLTAYADGRLPEAWGQPELPSLGLEDFLSLSDPEAEGTAEDGDDLDSEEKLTVAAEKLDGLAQGRDSDIDDNGSRLLAHQFKVNLLLPRSL